MPTRVCGTVAGMFVLRLALKSLLLGLVLILALGLAGCATRPAVDLSAPDWTVREGQAVWKSAPDAAGIAGDLTLATGRDGRSFVQFSKTPLPIVTAEIGGGRWRVSFAPQRQTYRGRGTPPNRVLWLQLPGALNGTSTGADWVLTTSATSPENWRLENRTTRESLDGYLTVVRPAIHR